MDDGVKMIFGLAAILLLAYVAGSIFFPELIRGINLTPMEFHWNVF